MSGRPSHGGAVARYLASAAARRIGRPDPDAGGGAPVRLEYAGLLAPAPLLRRYLEVTDGERVDSLAAGRLLPPTFPAVWETASILDLLRLGGYALPTAGVVHTASDRVRLRALPADEPVRLELRLGPGERSRSGARVPIAATLRNRLGQPCAEDRMTVLVRRAEPRSAPSIGHAAPPVPPPLGAAWRLLRRWSLRGGLGRSYASVSGDFNPIHLSAASARVFGFDGPIVHGCCLEAMIAHALVEQRLGGRAEALGRFAIRFIAPLRIPGEIQLEIAEREGGGWFRVEAEGGRVAAEGEWTGLSSDQG